MALTTCPDCGKEISDSAPTCPGCGRPMREEGQPEPQRVKTAEDSALTRSRGCADLVIWPVLIGVVVLLIAASRCGS